MSSAQQTPGQGPAAKRRRVDLASATLKKPFRSPLLTSKAPPPSPSPSLLRDDDGGVAPGDGDDDGDDDGGNTPGSPSVSRTTEATTKPTGRAVPMRQGVAMNRRYPAYQPTPTKNTPTSYSYPTTSATSNTHTTPSKRPPLPNTPRTNPTWRNAPPEPTADKLDDIPGQLARAQRARQASMNQMQKQLDLIRQARRIEERSSDVELRVLVGKWKAASRQAAEELFELIKGRVDGMGGGRAWRETRRQVGRGFDGGDEGRGGRGGWERGERGGSYGDGDGDGNGNGEGEDGRGDDEDGRGRSEGDGGGDDGDGDEEGFTMLMMLQSLNIDPDILGYDTVEEKWRD